MKANGRRRVAFWVTEQEEKLLHTTLQISRAGNALDAERGFRLDPEALYEEPVDLKRFTIVDVSPKLASALVRLWHSKLPAIPHTNIQRNRRYACFAFVHSGHAHGIAVYSSPVNQKLDQGTCLELRRLAMSTKCPKNSATYFMARAEALLVERMPEIDMLISYQDKEHHLGTVYKAGNWRVGKDNVRHTDRRIARPDRSPPQTTSKKVRWEKPLR